MQFYSKYRRPEKKQEVHYDEGLVERTGYLDTEAMVNQFLLAGERLKLFRGAMFDPGETVPDDQEPGPVYASDMDVILALRERVAVINEKLAEEQGNKKKPDPVPEPEPENKPE